MDPSAFQMLLPFLPMATLVAALVGLARDLFPRIDGKLVLLAAAIASVLVPIWVQGRGDGPFQWGKIATDAPAIFVLAVGGTKWLQRMKDRSRKPLSPEEANALMEQIAGVKPGDSADVTPLPVASP